MTTTLLLKTAAVISLLFAAGHTRGGLRKWSPMGENEVLSAMTERQFDVIAWRYILPVPALFSVLLLVVLVAAYFTAG